MCSTSIGRRLAGSSAPCRCRRHRKIRAPVAFALGRRTTRVWRAAPSRRAASSAQFQNAARRCPRRCTMGAKGVLGTEAGAAETVAACLQPERVIRASLACTARAAAQGPCVSVAEPWPAPALRATAVVAKTTVAETAEAARTEAVAWLWAMHHGGLPLPLSDGTSV